MTTAATDDEHPIGAWKDKSASGYTPTQTTDEERPSLQLAAQNGLPGVRGNDAGMLDFSGAALNILRNVSYTAVFMVYNPRQTAATRRDILWISETAGPGTQRMNIRNGSTANRMTVIVRNNSSNAFTVTSDTNHAGQTVLVSVIVKWSTGDITLRQNKAVVGTGSITSPATTTDAASFSASLYGTPAGSFDIGELHELLLINDQELSVAEIAQIEDYLASKWWASPF